MSTSTPMISHMSIFIFSYFLLNTGLNVRLPPGMAVASVLAGTAGIFVYLAIDWSLTRRTGASSGPPQNG
ncbi:MAG TPA: hypothetical protein VL475_06390 [Planctomycetaceae bacterium]|nr:hypothetical protein [Planctomycetaceae bacterium]